MPAKSPGGRPDDAIASLSDLLVDVRLLREECFALRAEVKRVEAREDRLRRQLDHEDASIRGVLDHMLDPVLVTRGAAVVYGNTAYRRLTGDEDAYQEPARATELFEAGDAARIDGLLRSVSESGTGESVRAALRTPSGERAVDVFARPLLDDGGSRCLLVLRDVTARADLEARSRIEGAALAANPVPTALVDRAGRIVRVNPSCARLLGIRASEVEGAAWTAFIDPTTRWARRLRRHVQVGRPWTGRVAVGRRALPIAVSPVRDVGGAVAGAVVTLLGRGVTGWQDGPLAGSTRGAPPPVESICLDTVLRDVGRRLRRRGVGVRYGLEAHLPALRGDGSLLETALWAVTRGVGAGGKVFFRTRLEPEGRGGSDPGPRVLLAVGVSPVDGALDLAAPGDPPESPTPLGWLERLARFSRAQVRIVTGGGTTTVELEFDTRGH